MKHFTSCDEVTTTFTKKKQLIVSQMKINNFNENIFIKSITDEKQNQVSD